MLKTLVVGAQGTVGSELVKLLTRKGHDVLSATHRPASAPGQVHFDLVTGAGLAAAFEGVERAFLMSPPGYTNQDELLVPVVDAARARGLRKVVLMSAMGANADDSTPLRKAELYLENSGVPYNIVRPNWFMQNFNGLWLSSILQQGKILLPVGKAKGSFIDARDIAATAAELLIRDDLNNRDFDLTGGQALDHDQVAAILSRETDRAIRFEEISPEAMLSALLVAKVPQNYAEFLRLILGFYKAGYSERTTPAVEQITGRPPGSFEQYAKDYRSAWLG
ncbi:MAG TPA: NAD(P)H-binding protein [Polyangiaceae bacterium]|nr:NAD(P)H-binding protein [Polyangiaceae bacterium]